MARVEFDPGDVDAVHAASLAAARRGDYESALTLAELTQRMRESRQAEIADEIVRRLTERPDDATTRRGA